jgi:hypothetical protein
MSKVCARMHLLFMFIREISAMFEASVIGSPGDDTNNQVHIFLYAAGDCKAL